MRSISRLCMLFALLLGVTSIASGQLVETPSLPGLIAGQPDLSYVAKALQGVGAVSALQGCGPFTIFAPIDCAWDGLCKPTSVDLLNPCNRNILTPILMYQTAKGCYGLCDFQDSKCCPIILRTLNGGTLAITQRGGDWYVDNAKILGESITAKNGRLFKIDRVLLPPGSRVQRKAE